MADLRFNNTITGLPEIRQHLKKLKVEMVGKINRSAARAGAREVERQADRRLPGNHRGRKKIDIQRSRSQSKRGLEVFKIGPKARHWGLVFFEFGAEPHTIRAKKKKALPIPFDGPRWGAPVVEYFTKRVKNPGVRQTRFLTRSITEAAPKVIDRIGRQYWKRIKKVTRGN